MKKTICIFGALLLSLCILTSCSGSGGGSGGSGSSTGSTDISGYWESNDKPGYAVEFSNGEQFELYKSGDTWYKPSDFAAEVYKISGTDIVIGDSEGSRLLVPFTLSGDTLTIEGKKYTKISIASVDTSKTYAEIKAL